MRLSASLPLSIVIPVLFAASNASAGVIWNESTDGDLSDAAATPTVLGTLGLGSNTMSGTSTAGTEEDLTIPNQPEYPDMNPDFWSLTIAPGQRLQNIALTNYSWTNPNVHSGASGPGGGVPGGGAFFGVQSGSQITGGITGPPSQLLGGGLIGILSGAQAGDDVLDDLGSGTFAALGVPTFSGPLGAGTYTFWYQEGPTDTQYSLDFQVTAVPEPTTLTGVGMLALAMLRFRRKKLRADP